MNETCYRNNCVGIAVIVSIIVGAIAAITAFGLGLILGPVFSWIALAIAVVALLITLAIAVFADCDSRRCLSRVFPTIITGIIGAIVAAIILLLLPEGVAVLVTAVFTGLLFAFLSLILTVTVCFIRCVIDE